jgi:hypothetical protein
VVPWICDRKGTEFDASQCQIPGAKRSFQVIQLSNPADILLVPFVDILTPAEVSISNEKSYNLIKEEQVEASKMLKIRNK